MAYPFFFFFFFETLLEATILLMHSKLEFVICCQSSHVVPLSFVCLILRDNVYNNSEFSLFTCVYGQLGFGCSLFNQAACSHDRIVG